MFLLIGIANEQIPRILKSSNSGSKIAKNAKSTLVIVESQNKTKMIQKVKGFSTMNNMTTFRSKTDAHAIARISAHMRECMFSVARLRVCTRFKIQRK